MTIFCKLVRGATFAWLVVGVTNLHAADGETPLAKVSPTVFSPEQREAAASAIENDIQRRTDAVNLQDRRDWETLTNRAQWEAFRDARIAKLRRSLGTFPAPAAQPKVRTTKVIEGDGFEIHNIIFESRAGQWAPGNLYVPAKRTREKSDSLMPGILIAHAHHRDKPQSELQDMGMTWARAGCLVLVIDQVGYGERRSHPFNSASDYNGEYRVSRQDYYFRFDTGVQLQLLGDSLLGWMTWDLMRGVDVLLAQDGIDPAKIIILGAVAGGGDPAAVTAALDARIACCVPFNFGGPQPESRYPLPDDAAQTFNLLGGSYWDSTRGLRQSGRDGFLHWLIVASTAPRRLIHAHEFAWDEPRDPAWQRYQKIWGEFYDKQDRVGAVHGFGTVKLRPPDASHCTNIGQYHRRNIHPRFAHWFGIQVDASSEYSRPLPESELRCFTDEVRGELRPKSLNALMTELGEERVENFRKSLASLSPKERQERMRKQWSALLGPIKPALAPEVSKASRDAESGSPTVERIVLEVEPGVSIPLLLLTPDEAVVRPRPVVVALSQEGKAGFLEHRGEEIAKLLKAGVAVALPEVRGTGEARVGESRGATSRATNLSVNIQLFGETLLGQRLRDLRGVLQHLGERPEFSGQKMMLWADCFTPVNPADTDFKLPRGIDGWPPGPEPAAGMLALLAALYDDDIHAVYIAGGLNNQRDILSHFAVLAPHDALAPGALTAGDLTDLAGTLSPRPLRLEALVDHLNRKVAAAEIEREYGPTKQAYASKPERFGTSAERGSAAEWILKQVR